MTALLEAKGLKKTYRMGKVLVPALQGVTFDVAEGEFLAVFGPVIFGIVICILFGLYPARKAAKLDPVEALRYE